MKTLWKTALIVTAISVLMPLVMASGKELSGVITISLQDTDTTTWEGIADAYTKLHPQVQVKVELKPSGPEYGDWVRTQFAAGIPEADLLNANMVWDLVNAGKFLDYMPYAKRVNPYTGKAWADGFDVEGQLAAGGSYWGGAYRWTQFNMETVQVLWFYNKRIFEEVGVEPPNTWLELVDISKKIKTAGYIPWAIEGDYKSFWQMRVGWLMRIYADQFTRDEIHLVRAQPEDYMYDPEVDGKWTYDPQDSHNDDPNVVHINSLRQYKALRDGEQPVDGAKWRAMYTNFKKMIPEYCPPGFAGVTDAYPLFLTQKAAMWLDGGWFISRFDRDIEDLAKTGGEKASIFGYGSFPMPTMEGPYVSGPIRTIEVPIGFWGIAKKTRAQNELAMDFLLFLTSPKGASIYLQSRLDPLNTTAEGIIGPLVIKGLELPPDLAEKFAQIKFIGNCEKLTAGAYRSRGIGDLPVSVREWVDLAQRYFMEEIGLDEFLTEYQKSVQKHLPTLLRKVGWRMEDLDTPGKEPPKRPVE